MVDTAALAKLEAAITGFEGDVSLAHQIIHGGKTDIIQTEGGPVDSLAKAIQYIRDTGIGLPPGGTALTTYGGDGQWKNRGVLFLDEGDPLVIGRLGLHSNAIYLIKGSSQAERKPTGSASNFSATDYLGVLDSDPLISNHRAGQWFFSSTRRVARVFFTDPDLSLIHI